MLQSKRAKLLKFFKLHSSPSIILFTSVCILCATVCVCMHLRGTRGSVACTHICVRLRSSLYSRLNVRTRLCSRTFGTYYNFASWKFSKSFRLIFYLCHGLESLVHQSSKFKVVQIVTSITAPQDAHTRLVLQVYLGANTLEFSARSR